MSCFEEPKECVCIWRKVDVTRVGVDAFGGLTDASLARLLVTNSRTVGGVNRRVANNICREASWVKLGERLGVKLRKCANNSRQAQCQRDRLDGWKKHSEVIGLDTMLIGRMYTEKGIERKGETSYLYVNAQHTITRETAQNPQSISTMTAAQTSTAAVHEATAAVSCSLQHNLAGNTSVAVRDEAYLGRSCAATPAVVGCIVRLFAAHRPYESAGKAIILSSENLRQVD